MTAPGAPCEQCLAWQERTAGLVTMLCDESRCRYCGATIYLCVTRGGLRASLDLDGTNHFANCPDAAGGRKCLSPP